MNKLEQPWYQVGKIVEVSDRDGKKTFALRVSKFMDVEDLASLLKMNTVGKNGKEYPNSLLFSTPKRKHDESEEEFEKRTDWYAMEAFIKNPTVGNVTKPSF